MAVDIDDPGIWAALLCAANASIDFRRGHSKVLDAQ